MPDRYGFKFQIYVHTFRNYFPSQTPTGLQLAHSLMASYQSGAVTTIPYGTQKISIADIDVNNNELKILFHLYDPLIQDPDYVDHKSGNIRLAARLAGEEPARSAHLLVDLSPAGDLLRTYPAGLENAEYLSRSLISRFLNDTCELLMSQQMTWTSKAGEQSQKKYSPRVQLQAHLSQSIEGLLNNGGKLLTIKSVSARLKQTTFGDQAFPVVEEEDLVFKVQNSPSGSAAKSILERVWQDLLRKEPKKVTVVIDDDAEDRLKSVNVDVNKGNILENVFIRQFNLGRFSPDLRLCEPKLRTDLIDEMRRKLL